ncbi:MAG: porin [Mesorhizobium sp.]|nr:porin [Mesorhizobium sp.]
MEPRAITLVVTVFTLLGAVPAYADPDDDDRAPEYVKVCDVYGAGFFYIPGTETCLRISGSVTHSTLQNDSDLGLGTAVRAGLSERFGVQLKNTMSRWGGAFGFEYGLGAAGTKTKAYDFVFGEFQFAGGSSTASGAQQIGTDGVTAVGYTYLFPDIGGTGVIANSAGFGLVGDARMKNDWQLGFVGYGLTFPVDDDDDKGSAFVVKAGLYLDRISFGASGASDLTFNGAPFAGYYQNFDYSSSDLYVGVKSELNYLWQCRPTLQFSVGANLFAGYHRGSGDIRQETGIGGPVIVQTDSYRKSDMFVGAGLSAGVEWRVFPNVTLGSTVAVDLVPDLTTYRAPQNPNEQPGGWESDTSLRVKADILRIRATF